MTDTYSDSSSPGAMYRALGISQPDDTALRKSGALLGQAEKAYKQEQEDPEIKRLRETKAKEAEKHIAESDSAFKSVTPFNPQEAPKPQDYQTNPLQTFGSLASVFGILASAFTHQPWYVGMQAAAAAINARNQGDELSYKHAFDNWKANTDLMLKRHDLAMEDWRAMNDKFQGDQTALDAALTAHEAKYEDPALKVLRLSGQYGQMYDLMARRADNANKLRESLPAMLNADMMARAEFQLRDAMQSGDDTKLESAVENFNKVRSLTAPMLSPAQVASKATVVIDPAHKDQSGKEIPAIPFVYNPLTHQATTLDGRPYQPTSIAKLPSGASATITDDAADLIADEYVGGNRQAIVGFGRSPTAQAKIQDAIAKKAKDLNLSGAMLNAMQGVFQGELQGQRTLGSRAANMEVAANEVDLMAPLALEASEKVNRTEYPSLNKIILSAERGTGGKDVVQFGLAANSLIYTYAKFLNPTGIPTDADKARSAEILDTAWANGQFRAAIDQIKREIKSGQAAISSTKGEISRLVTGQTSVQNPATPANKDEYDRLPSGSYYRKPDDPIGIVRQKP